MTKNRDRYLIAIDLDGTLLTDKKKIRLKSKLFLRKLEKERSIVAISTGRPVRTALPFYNELKTHGPLLCYNGAYCFDPNDSNFNVIRNPVSPTLIKKHYKYLIDNYADAALSESLTTIYIDGEYHVFDFTLNYDNNLKMVEGSFDKTVNEDVYSFIMHTKYRDEKHVKEIKKYVERNLKGYCVDFWSDDWYFEVRKEGINKAATIEKIQKLYKIPHENILTFGDSTNDIQLVSSFKNGYAMINGREHIKDFAKNITKKDNNHNGVVHEIKTYLKSH